MKMMTRDRTARLFSTLCGSLLAFAACGDDSGGDDPENGNGGTEGTVVLYEPTDPCDEDTTPQPNQLFSPEDLATCPLPSDPVDAAIAALERGEGAEVDTAIELRVDRTILPESLSSTVTFSLDGTGSTDGLPPLVLLRRVATGTSAESFELVDFVASRDGLKVIRIEPSQDLANGAQYFAIATRAMRDDSEEPAPFAASDAVRVVVGDAEPEDVDITDEDVAARLLAERGRVSDVLALVAQAGQPAIRSTDIVSIHSFRTKLGPERLVRLARRYSEAFAVGRVPLDIAITDNQAQLGEISPIPPDNPDDFDDKVGAIQRGVIAVPRFLDEEGRLRETWDTDNQSIDVNFLLSEPAGAGSSRIAVMFSGFGRGETDVIPMAPENANLNTAIMVVDLRCHGSRSPDPLGVCREERSPSEIEGLVDQRPNNGDTRVLPGSPDGIPDDSGRYFFTGDPGKLRDTQIAAALEILHILSVLRFEADVLADAASIDVRDGELALVAHTQAAPVALAALAMFEIFPEEPVPARNRLRRALFLGAGVGYEELILEGPAQLETDFLETAPEGIDEDNVSRYLRELEGTVLEALDPAVLGPRTVGLFAGEGEAAIYYPGVDNRDVPVSARERLDDVLDPDRSVRASNVSCEHFLFFPCQGNEVQATVQARGPAANFLSGASF